MGELIVSEMMTGIFRNEYLREASVDKKVEDTTEDLVPHQDSEVEISYRHCAVVFLGVWEVAGGRQANTNHVK